MTGFTVETDRRTQVVDVTNRVEAPSRTTPTGP